MTNDLALIIALLLLACLALLVVLLVRQNQYVHQQSRNQDRNEVTLERLGNQILDELDAQHDQILENQYNANQSLVSTMSQIGQGQSSLLESMQRQVLLATRNQEESASRASSAMNDSLSRLDARMDQLRESNQASFASLRQENDRQLTEMRKTVSDRLSESLDQKLDSSFAQVSQRLESVYKGLGEMHTLASGVGDLKKVLTNVKTRGIWGEMQAGSIIQQVLAPEQFAENVQVIPNKSERVEFAIRLPNRAGENVWLPVDSKFPQEDYLRLVECSQQGNASGVEAARKALFQRIRQEAVKIADKYISPPHTTDFAIMFLPVEGLYAEVLQSPDLVERIQRDSRVVISGPSTFAALLNVLQMGFRTMAIEQRSGEVWRLLGAIKNDFNRFSEVLEDTRKRLDQAGESIDSAVSRSRSIQRKLSDMETDPSLSLSDSFSSLPDSAQESEKI